MTSEIDPIATGTGAEVIRNALIGGSPDPTFATAVRQDLADEADDYPYIVFRRVSVFRDVALDNTLLGVKETYHIECWGKTREQSALMEDKVVDLLLAAGMPPSSNETDGLDPLMLLRAAVVVVEIWL